MARKYDADSIVVIESDREKVRKNPSMYLPDVYAASYTHMGVEIIDNSIDELTVKGSVGSHLDVTYDEKTKEFSVADDGSGIPLEKLYDVLTKLAASGKFNNGENSAYQATAGRWGHGLKTAVFLSDHCEFTSMRDGKFLKYIFEDGNMVKKEEGKSDKHGTYSKFHIDLSIIDYREVTWRNLYDRLVDKSYLFPDLKITYTVLDGKKEIKKFKFGGKDIEDRVEQWKPDTPTIRVKEKRPVTFLKNITDDKLTTEKVDIDIVFAFKEGVLDADNRDDFIISYANGAKTYMGGTHIDGLRLGIQKYFKEDVISKFKGKDKELNILPSDMTAGLCAFVTVRVTSPIYMGQEKSMLSNQEVKVAVRDAVYDALCNSKANVTNPMIEFVKRVTRGRIATKKVRKKDVANAFSKDRLEKYRDIVENLNTTSRELLLVEGDSASDNAALGRDPYNQAIYSIRRPKNLFDAESSAVNRIKSTFNDVLDICGITAGDKCDPEKCVMDRILALTDSDVDGDDIAISVICLLAKHCRPLIDAGMVGRILPPAYRIPKGNGKNIYVRSQKDFYDKITKAFIDKETVSYNGKVFGKKELREFIERNFEYDTRLEKLANRYCVDPKFMEYLAWHYHGEVKDQKKSYWSAKLRQFPGLAILIENNTLVIDGDINGGDYINIALDDHFHKHVMRFKEFQKVNSTLAGYEISGKKDQTLYDVMHMIRKYIPAGVERYKGLGEVNGETLRELCMDPKTRTVVIFKFSDFEKDMDKISVIMSTKKEYAAARKKILFSLRASELDLDT